MPYSIPPMETMLARLIALFKAFFPLSNVGSKVSYHWRRLKVLAGGITDLHYHIARLLDDAMPDRAIGTALLRWAGIVGVTPKTSTPARKSDALRVRGAPAATVAVGDQLIHNSSGLLYQVNENEVIPAAGFVDVDVLAVSTGAQTRLLKGEVLTFLAAPAGIESDAELVLDLDEDGFDKEQEGELRNRTLDAFRYAAAGGNQADFVKWAKEITGITYAFCYPNRAGIGSIDVAALHTGSGSSRVLSAGEMTTLLAYLKTKAPAYLAGTGGALRVLTTVIDPKVVEITVTPNGDTSNEFDWNDNTPATVLAWTLATRTLQFTGGARPATMQAGHRIVLKGVASVQDGRQYTIESLSGADSVVLEVAPTVNPAATDIVYSGGPLVDQVRDAVLAHMNGDVVYAGDEEPIPGADAESTVGLKVLADGIGTANPAGAYGTWSGALVRAVLGKLATAPRGVRNCSVITPATDTEATDYTFPNDHQIGLITPSAVIIRKTW